jgi:hypothetical protein
MLIPSTMSSLCDRGTGPLNSSTISSCTLQRPHSGVCRSCPSKTGPDLARCRGGAHSCPRPAATNRLPLGAVIAPIEVCGLSFYVDCAPYVASYGLGYVASYAVLWLLPWPGQCGASMVRTMRLPMLASMIHLWATTRGTSFPVTLRTLTLSEQLHGGGCLGVPQCMNQLLPYPNTAQATHASNGTCHCVINRQCICNRCTGTTLSNVAFFRCIAPA